MGFEIGAGTVKERREDSGEWLFVDVGFSSTGKSCGVLKDRECPRAMKFDQLLKCVVKEVQTPGPPLNLLLEAPLSIAVDRDRNPARRRTDTEGKEHRDWWYGPGATTLLAAGHLLREVKNCGIQREVRLFEGFASFKATKVNWSYNDNYKKCYGFFKTHWSHIQDVLRLQCTAWDPNPRQGFVTYRDELKTEGRKRDDIEFAFKFADMDFGIPPVVKACTCGSDLIDDHLLCTKP